jgi:hypothetical protein
LTWRCEYCSLEQAVVGQHEPQQSNDCSFKLCGADEKYKDRSKGVVVTLDMSGSMTSWQSGVEQLNKPFVTKRNEHIMELCLKNKKQVPRLEEYDPSLFCTALAAIDSNVSQIAAEEPKTKVGLLGFENTVHVMGDCMKPSIAIPSHLMSNQLGITNFVNENCDGMMNQ